MPKLRIERSIVINSPSDVVYQAIRNFERWPEWSPWLVTERDASLVFADDGQSYSWEGNLIGSGEMRLLDGIENQSLQHRLTFLKPWKSQSTVGFTFSQVEGGTEVTWRMDGSLPFFMFFMKGMMEGIIGMDYERGLGMLKELIEEGTVTSELRYHPDSHYPGCHYVGIKRSCNQADMGAYMVKDFESLHVWAEENGVQVSAKPFSIYSKWDFSKGEAEYTAGLPVGQSVGDLPVGFISGELPACQAYVIEHVGAYHHLGNAWSAGICRARAKLFKQSKKIYPFEVYETDPHSVPESELVTKVYLPLK